MTGIEPAWPAVVSTKVVCDGPATWEDDWGYERFRFTPLRTWLGSANWTALAPLHLESGLWTNEPKLMEANQRFLLDVVRFSQPLGGESEGPAP
ncbi:MAG: hypothetical protein M3Q47_05635 [Actinomycetota bacterium]|nr:hypothetical protein [Actinomycetota bacterium]